MSSQLYQRLRAARQYADKTQTDIAQACGVGRAAVTLWESANPDHRTRPSVEQIMKISQLTGVPVDWLLNDSSDANDVWKVGSLHAPPATRAKSSAPPAPPQARRAKNFWASVEFHVAEQNPEAAESFGYPLQAGDLFLKADYLHDRVIMQFGDASDVHELTSKVGKLLLLEKAVGRLLKKHLVLWVSNTDDPVIAERVKSLASPILEAFGVSLAVVSSPNEAADYIIQHG